MPALELHTSELDAFVADVDRRNLLGSTEEELPEIQLKIDTVIDQSLDPFSEDYTNQQIQLYSEISGRRLNQTEFEKAELDPSSLAGAANPYGSKDCQFIASHVRAVASAIITGNLPVGGRVLDMGCGWGLSTEVMEFCGATVHSVDINPLFVELVAARAARRSGATTAELSEFDSFSSDDRFDMIFFYECLHHAVRPWRVLERMARHLKPGGKVVLAGEPINNLWWKHWGIRLDALSVYCIRKFGWFESGWSEDFLISCFARCGLDCELVKGVGLRHGIISVAQLKGQSSTEPIANRSLEAPLGADYSKEVARLRKQLEQQRADTNELREREKEAQRKLQYHSANPTRALKLWWHRKKNGKQ